MVRLHTDIPDCNGGNLPAYDIYALCRKQTTRNCIPRFRKCGLLPVGHADASSGSTAALSKSRYAVPGRLFAAESIDVIRGRFPIAVWDIRVQAHMS